ncbi:MAG TPA: endonuclease/exonuclease/phosphatase family protein [Kiritimatiellia bacterium]|nr:endonuclease/exonuclease/phosphatase family protein [Kiritimatiellia bacterium]
MKRFPPFRAAAALFAAVLLAAATAMAQAWPRPPRPADDEFSVMTYNLWRFSYEDRDRDGQKDNFKPEDQIAALVAVVSNARPDVLAVQEIGDGDSFEILRRRLGEAGLDMPHTEYFILPHSTVGLGLLSRFPIVGRHSITNETHTLGGEELPVQRGFLVVDIQVNPKYRFRLFNAHLKSKLFHPLGQTEMRRNEARLLNKHVRRAIDRSKNLNVVVVGDMNDRITSSPLRELIGRPRYLHDLRPRDFVGDIWTHLWEFNEEYSRIDYIFVNDAMRPEVVADKSYVVRDPQAALASDHRPVIAVFKASDLKPE